MEVSLKEATVNDCEKIHQMQIIGFKALLDKYQDYETNPGAESLEKIKWRFQFPQGKHYFIEANGEDLGYIRVVSIDEQTYRLSQMFILPDYQENGYAQQASSIYALWSSVGIKEKLGSGIALKCDESLGFEGEFNVRYFIGNNEGVRFWLKSAEQGMRIYTSYLGLRTIKAFYMALDF